MQHATHPDFDILVALRTLPFACWGTFPAAVAFPWVVPAEGIVVEPFPFPWMAHHPSFPAGGNWESPPSWELHNPLVRTLVAAACSQDLPWACPPWVLHPDQWTDHPWAWGRPFPQLGAQPWVEPAAAASAASRGSEWTIPVRQIQTHAHRHTHTTIIFCLS